MQLLMNRPFLVLIKIIWFDNQFKENCWTVSTNFREIVYKTCWKLLKKFPYVGSTLKHYNTSDELNPDWRKLLSSQWSTNLVNYNACVTFSDPIFVWNTGSLPSVHKAGYHHCYLMLNIHLPYQILDCWNLWNSSGVCVLVSDWF